LPEPLLLCLQRHLKDAKAFEARLAGRAVLLYEPPDDDAPLGSDEGELQDSAAFRFRTVSGVTDNSMGSGEPTVAYLEKTKDNAFQSRITLGRTGNNDIEIDAPSVSRFHAWFQRDEAADGWVIIDAGSKNGTHVAGKKLTPKKPAALANNTKLKVGHVELTFFTASGFIKSLNKRGTS
jgi:hypothetical protein